MACNQFKAVTICICIYVQCETIFKPVNKDSHNNEVYNEILSNFKETSFSLFYRS